MQKKYFVDIIINKEKLSTGEDIHVAHCTSLGIASQGKGVDEAIKNVKEAVQLYLEECPEKLKELSPAECPPTLSFLEIKSIDQKISIF